MRRHRKLFWRPSDKGKLEAIRGRKATDLAHIEIAGLPKRARRV